MRKLLPYIAILLTAGFMFFAPFEAVEAQSAISEMRDGADTTGTQGGKNVDEVIKTVVNVGFFLLGALAVIMIIYSGIRYVTSAGNAASVTSAKNTLIYSVVGLIVAILAYAIVDFIIDALA